MRPRSAAQRRQDFGAQRRARRTHFALRGVAQKLPPAQLLLWSARARKMMAVRCRRPAKWVGWVVVATPVRPGSCPGKRDVTQDNKYNRVSSLPAVGSLSRPANSRPRIDAFASYSPTLRISPMNFNALKSAASGLATNIQQKAKEAAHEAGHLAESECSSRVCCPMSSHSHARRALLFLWPAAALSLAARGGAHVPDRCPPPPACQCRGTRSRGRRHERAHRRGRHAPRAQVIFAKKSLRRVTASLLQHAAIDGL